MLTLTPEELTAIKLSLRVALVATVVSLPIGILVALLLARGRFIGRSLLNAFVLVPLVLPPVVTGYVLLLLFGRQGPLGRWFEEHLGIVFAFRWTGAALACAIMGFPLMVRHSPVDRGRGPKVGAGRRHSRSEPAVGIRHHYAPVDRAGNICWSDPGFRARYG